MIKFSRVEDVYFFDEVMSIPGVRQGYLERASSGDPDFVVIKDSDGFEGVFAKGNDERLIPVGPAIRVAKSITETVTDVSAGTVRPGAAQGEMREIPQTGFEKALEKTGLTLEQFGKELENLGSISIGGVEFTLRDIIPFVGYSQKVESPITGQEETIQSGTPKALQMAGRGESLIKGKGMTTELKREGKDVVADIATTLPIATIGKTVKKVMKKSKSEEPKRVKYDSEGRKVAQ